MNQKDGVVMPSRMDLPVCLPAAAALLPPPPCLGGGGTVTWPKPHRKY